MRGIRAPLVAAALAAVVLAAYGIVGRDERAPDVAFVSIEGERTTTADLRGSVALVEFWSTDCAVCIREMPDIAALYEAYRGRGYTTIAVAMRHDPPNYVLHYAERAALPFTVALDPMGDIAAAFGRVNATPTRILIGRRGNVAARMVGPLDMPALRERIERELAQPAGAVETKASAVGR